MSIFSSLHRLIPLVPLDNGLILLRFQTTRLLPYSLRFTD